MRDGPPGWTALQAAIWHEWKSKSPDARRISDWIVLRGADLQSTLNRMLLVSPIGRMPGLPRRDVPAYLEFLLARGADPNWLPPNGISVLEHALVRFADPAAVDVIARRVTPKKAFWIAAGLGDVSAVRGYFDRAGRLKKSAHAGRPDFAAILPHPVPSLPDASDLDVMFEAFYVAALNHRWEALDVLLQHGVPIDHAAWGAPLLNLAVGNMMLPLVEHLVKRGARVDIRGWRPCSTAREIAEFMLTLDPPRPEAREIFILCGGKDPDEVRRRALEAMRKRGAS